MMGPLTIALAFLFLALLLRLILWPAARSSGSGPQDFAVEFPSRLAGERICSEDDLRFIEGHAPELRSQYLRERKALMLIWLRNLRQAVASSVRSHRAAASVESSAKLTIELRLAAEYLSFLVLWQAASSLVWMTNPVTARFITSRVISVGEQLSLAARLISSERSFLSRSVGR
jgi:hypothetical protein